MAGYSLHSLKSACSESGSSMALNRLSAESCKIGVMKAKMA